MDAYDRYIHDCDDCIGLGKFSLGNRRFDLYFCPRCDGGSVLARYGDRGSDYASSPLDILDRLLEEPSQHSAGSNALLEAYRRVRELGLLGDVRPHFGRCVAK